MLIITLRRVLFVCVLFCLLYCAGCSHVNGYDWRSGEWAKSPRLDRVQVVVLDAREGGRMSCDAPVVAPKADVETWTRDALQAIPGVIVVGDTPPAGKTGNAGGAMMLCRITMGEAGNRLLIGVPVISPLWSREASISYDIELIDIPTGETRFKAVRFVTSGGHYNLLPLPEISALYERDIAHVLHFATLPALPSPPAPGRMPVPAVAPPAHY